MSLQSFLGKAACYILGRHKRSRRITQNGVAFMQCPRCGFLRVAKKKANVAG